MDSSGDDLLRKEKIQKAMKDFEKMMEIIKPYVRAKKLRRYSAKETWHSSTPVCLKEKNA